MLLAKKLNKGAGTPVVLDAQFNYVTMLLHGDGTNGAQNNTFVDSSSNTFSITRNGNTTQGSFSPYGSNWSNYFGGADYISAPNNTALQIGSSDFTIECWYYNTVAAGDVLWSKAANGSAFTGYYLNIQGGARTPNFYATANGSSWAVNLSSSILMTINQWNHVAVTRNGSTWTIWVNGVSGGTATVSATILDDGSPFVVGALANNTSNITGYVSNLRFVKGTALYTSAFTPSTTSLTAVSGTSLLTCQSNRYIDNSTNAFAITVNGTPSVQRFNPFGTATAYSTSVIGGSGYFDGTGDYLQVANNSAFDFSGDFTVECWLYLANTNNQTFISKGGHNALGPDAAGWALFIYTGQGLRFMTRNSGGTNVPVTVASTPQINTWMHVAVSRSGSSMRAFLNGTLVSTVTSSVNTANSSPFNIGANLNNLSPSTGYICDVRIIKGTAQYTATFTPPTAPLTAITDTQFLENFTNAAIFDNAMMNDLETVGNAQISTSVVKFGTGSIAFDGSGDYVQVPSSPINTNWTGNWTIEFWLYASASGAVYYLYKGSGLQIWGIDGTMKCSISATNNSTYFIDSNFGTISANTWTHISVVRNGNSYDGYVNGVKTNLGTSSSSANTGTEPLRVGSYAGGFGFTGYIDDLRITNGYARYTATFTPPTSALSDTGPY